MARIELQIYFPCTVQRMISAEQWDNWFTSFLTSKGFMRCNYFVRSTCCNPNTCLLSMRTWKLQVKITRAAKMNDIASLPVFMPR